MAREDTSDGGDHEPREDGRERHTERPLDGFLRSSDELAPGLHFGDGDAAALEERLPLGRERDAARGAVQENDAELRLEARDRLAHRRGGDAETRRGAVKALLLGRVDEREDAGEGIHAARISLTRS